MSLSQFVLRVVAPVALAAPMVAPAATTLYVQDFERPAGFVNDGGDVNLWRGVNQLYGGQPAGFAFDQQGTVETLRIGGTQAWGRGFTDPQSRGGRYALGMLSDFENDLLALSFNVGSYRYLNFRFDISSIDLDRWSGPFVGPRGAAPRFRISLFDNPGGGRGLGTGTPLSFAVASGTRAPNPWTFDWTNVVVPLDARNSTNGNVILRIDLTSGGYAAMDNFVVAASNLPGEVPPIPEPGSVALFCAGSGRPAGSSETSLGRRRSCGNLVVRRRLLSRRSGRRRPWAAAPGPTASVPDRQCMCISRFLLALFVASTTAQAAHAASFSSLAELDWSAATFSVAPPSGSTGPAPTVTFVGSAAYTRSFFGTASGPGDFVDGAWSGSEARADTPFSTASTPGSSATLGADPSSGAYRVSTFASDVLAPASVCPPEWTGGCGAPPGNSAYATAVSTLFYRSTGAGVVTFSVPYRLTVTQSGTGGAGLPTDGWLGYGVAHTRLGWNEVHTERSVTLRRDLSFADGTTTSGGVFTFDFVFRGAGTQNFTSTVESEVAMPALSPVPEPHEWAMMLAGLGVVGWVRRRDRQSPHRDGHQHVSPAVETSAVRVERAGKRDARGSEAQRRRRSRAHEPLAWMALVRRGARRAMLGAIGMTMIAQTSHAASFSSSATLDWSKATWSAKPPPGEGLPTPVLAFVGSAVGDQTGGYASGPGTFSNQRWQGAVANVAGFDASAATLGSFASLGSHPSSGSLRVSASASDALPYQVDCPMGLAPGWCDPINWSFDNRGLAVMQVRLTYVASAAGLFTFHVPYQLTVSQSGASGRPDVTGGWTDFGEAGVFWTTPDEWGHYNGDGVTIRRDLSFADGASATTGRVDIDVHFLAPGAGWFLVGAYAQAAMNPVAPVPEPRDWAMLLVGLGVLGSVRRRFLHAPLQHR